MTKTIHMIKHEVEAKLKQANLEGVEVSISHQVLRRDNTEWREVTLWKGDDLLASASEETFALATEIAIAKAKSKLNPTNEVVTIKTK